MKRRSSTMRQVLWTARMTCLKEARRTGTTTLEPCSKRSPRMILIISLRVIRAPGRSAMIWLRSMRSAVEIWKRLWSKWFLMIWPSPRKGTGKLDLYSGPEKGNFGHENGRGGFKSGSVWEHPPKMFLSIFYGQSWYTPNALCIFEFI